MRTLWLALLCLGTASAARDRTGMVSLVFVATASAWQVPAGGLATAVTVNPQPVNPQPAVSAAMFSGGKAAPKRRAVVKPATKRAPKPAFKKVVKQAATKKLAPPKVKTPAARKPVQMRPAVRKPAVRKPVQPRPGTVVWSGNGQRMVVPRKSVRLPPPNRKPKSMLKSSAKAQAKDDDFSPLPLLGVTAGVLIFTTLANVRAPPPPSVDANLLLAFTVLAGLAALVFTGDEKEPAPVPVTAPADAPERERKRDRLRRMFDLRRKAATAADAAPIETAPADAPADGAAPSTPGRFGRFRARFSTKKT
jgi:hypothetical protein